MGESLDYGSVSASARVHEAILIAVGCCQRRLVRSSGPASRVPSSNHPVQGYDNAFTIGHCRVILAANLVTKRLKYLLLYCQHPLPSGSEDTAA